MKKNVISVNVYAVPMATAKSNGAKTWYHVLIHMGNKRVLKIGETTKEVVMPGSEAVIELWGNNVQFDWIDLSQGTAMPVAEKKDADATDSKSTGYSMKRESFAFEMAKMIVEGYSIDNEFIPVDWSYEIIEGKYTKYDSDGKAVTKRDGSNIKTDHLVNWFHTGDYVDPAWCKEYRHAELLRHWRKDLTSVERAAKLAAAMEKINPTKVVAAPADADGAPEIK